MYMYVHECFCVFPDRIFFSYKRLDKNKIKIKKSLMHQADITDTALVTAMVNVKSIH